MSNLDYILINFQRITITLFCFTLLDSQICLRMNHFALLTLLELGGWAMH